jgi:hypothetical protein
VSFVLQSLVSEAYGKGQLVTATRRMYVNVFMFVWFYNETVTCFDNKASKSRMNKSANVRIQ